MRVPKACALLLAFALAAAAAEPFFFIQGTDPQFGMYADNANFDQETANFEFFVSTVNRLKPAFVVVTGDLVNRPGDPAETAEYLRLAKKLDAKIPLHNVPGNHDLGNTPTPAALAAYREKFGPDYYTFGLDGTAFFVLDTPLIYDPSQAPGEEDKQEAWLKLELKKAKQDGVRHLIVLQHHPWFLDSPEEADKYDNLPRARRAWYLSLLREYGVSYAFAGHYHQNRLSRFGPLAIVTTGPIGKPLRGAHSGFRVVIVRDTGVEHHYCEFGDLPNGIEVRR